MSLETELAAIDTTAAIAPLTDRAFLRITGPDATRWLNGMVTNNIKDLSPGEGNYNFLLNAQGRIQGDCTIYREPANGEEAYLLATDAAQSEAIHQLLDRFIIMDDVELTPTLSDQQSLLLLGPNAPELLRSLGLPTPNPLHLVHATTEHGPVLLLTPVASNTFELRAPAATTAATIAALLAAISPAISPTVDLSPAALEAHRILTATPRYGTDIRNTETAKDLPQETRQTHALHFNKGCYLGQEIVERIHSRGQVHRAFTAFTLTGALPQLPAPIEANGKPAGELTSAMQIGSTLHALGYLRREFATQPLTYPNGTATPKNI